MSPDEALDALIAPFPSGDAAKVFRERQKQAEEELAALTGEPLRALLPRLVQQLDGRHATSTLKSLAIPFARASLETNTLRAYVERLASQPYFAPYIEALDTLSRRKVEVWPLVCEVLSNGNVSKFALERVLRDYFLVHPEATDQFVDALSKRPAAALSAAWGTFATRPLPALSPAVVRFVLENTDDALRISAINLLSASTASDQEAAQLRQLVDAASVQLRGALASFFSRRAASKNEVPTRFLNDPHPDVRYAAFNAFTSRESIPRTELQVVIRAWGDADARIREAAERVLRPFTEAHGLTPDELEPINALLAGKERDDVASFLAWAALRHVPLRDWCLQQLDPNSKLFATLSAKHTLVCVDCYTLGKGDSWSHELDDPRARRKLEPVATFEEATWDSASLLRCKACFAHFTLHERSEIDVNSRHDFSLLRRLKLSELQREFPTHFDAKDPHFAHWQEAAQSDLQHVDPKVREFAKWELEA